MCGLYIERSSHRSRGRESTFNSCCQGLISISHLRQTPEAKSKKLGICARTYSLRLVSAMRCSNAMQQNICSMLKEKEQEEANQVLKSKSAVQQGAAACIPNRIRPSITSSSANANHLNTGWFDKASCSLRSNQRKHVEAVKDSLYCTCDCTQASST